MRLVKIPAEAGKNGIRPTVVDPQDYESWSADVGIADGSNDWTAMYSGPIGPGTLPTYIPVPEYRTLVTPEEFIGLFNNDQWGDCVTTADTDAAKFITKLQNYTKSFDTGHAVVTAGMTDIVQAVDIDIDQTEALEIVKGVRL